MHRLACLDRVALEEAPQIPHALAGLALHPAKLEIDGGRRSLERVEPAFDGAEPPVSFVEGGNEGVGLLVGGRDRAREPIDLASQLGRLERELGRVGRRGLVPCRESAADFGQRSRHDLLGQDVPADPRDHRFVDRLDGPAELVRAHGVAAVAMVAAAVDPDVHAADLAARDLDRAAAVAASSEARQQVLGLAPRPLAPASLRALDTAAHDFGHGLIHDPQFGRLDANPVAGVARNAHLRPASIGLLEAVPDDHAAVAIAVEHRADARVRPRSRSTPARAGWRDSARVEVLRDLAQALARTVASEDLADDRGFLGVDPVLDPPNLALGHRHVVVAVAATTDVETAARLGLQVLVDALRDLLPLHLGRVVADRHHELVRRGVEPDLLLREVVEEPDAVIDQVLDQHACAERVTPKAALVPGDEHIELASLRSVQHRGELGPLLELRAAHSVLDEDPDHGPAVRLAEAPSLGFLDLEGLELVFVRGPSDVERGLRHRDPFG